MATEFDQQVGDQWQNSWDVPKVKKVKNRRPVGWGHLLESNREENHDNIQLRRKKNVGQPGKTLKLASRNRKRSRRGYQQLH